MIRATKKIGALKQRVRAVYRQVAHSHDGWQENWLPGPFIWASIMPISHFGGGNAYEQEDLLKGKQAHTLYRVLMRKRLQGEHSQCSIRRLHWGQELLEIVYPWQEQVNNHWMESVGKIVAKGDMQ